MDSKADTRKGLHDIVGGDPVIRILIVVVIAIHRKAVAADKVIAIAVAVFIFGADIVVADAAFKLSSFKMTCLCG